MAWISFGALPCRKKKTLWQLASQCCWNRARRWHASELVSFLVGLRTYQHPGTTWYWTSTNICVSLLVQWFLRLQVADYWSGSEVPVNFSLKHCSVLYHVAWGLAAIKGTSLLEPSTPRSACQKQKVQKTFQCAHCVTQPVGIAHQRRDVLINVMLKRIA